MLITLQQLKSALQAAKEYVDEKTSDLINDSELVNEKIATDESVDDMLLELGIITDDAIVDSAIVDSAIVA